MMKAHCLILLSLTLSTVPAFAADSIYCPQRQGYIKVGMTEAEVINACGEPLTKQATNRRPTEKIEVKQLIYNNIHRGNFYYTLDPIMESWSLPSGSKGISIQVDIVNNKIENIQFNGSSTNALSICDNGSFQVGDSEAAVYNACGQPQFVNDTFVNQPIPGNERPVVWIYQVNQFQQPYTLTFTNGTLQSID